MKLWITSDTHYGHVNIIKYCDRPFSDVWEMNVALSQAWNARVADEDTVLHLGDVTLIKDEDRYTNTIDMIRTLKGRKVLVTGNHDHKRMIPVYVRWGWKVTDRIVAGDVMLVHVPPVEQPKGIGLVLHGHSHGKVKRENYIDVGVDALPDYAPVDLQTLLSTERYQMVLAEVLKLCTSNV